MSGFDKQIFGGAAWTRSNASSTHMLEELIVSSPDDMLLYRRG